LDPAALAPAPDPGKKERRREQGSNGGVRLENGTSDQLT